MQGKIICTINSIIIMTVMINSPYIIFYRFQVMKTCKRLGIKTVAIYSEADANAVCFDKFLRILIFARVIHTVLVKMLNKCSVYSCLIKSALEHAGSTLPLILSTRKKYRSAVSALKFLQTTTGFGKCPRHYHHLHWPGFFQVIGPPTSP